MYRGNVLVQSEYMIYLLDCIEAMSYSEYMNSRKWFVLSSNRIKDTNCLGCCPCFHCGKAEIPAPDGGTGSDIINQMKLSPMLAKAIESLEKCHPIVWSFNPSFMMSLPGPPSGAGISAYPGCFWWDSSPMSYTYVSALSIYGYVWWLRTACAERLLSVCSPIRK